MEKKQLHNIDRKNALAIAFLVPCGGTLYALDTLTGMTKWTVPNRYNIYNEYEDPWHSSPIIDIANQLILMGGRYIVGPTDKGNVYYYGALFAINETTGETVYV